ncbi:serine/threonine-protein kinase [Rossellomorea vietnamensis]|uniref:Serine/threonine-protein kinase n=1 Tax=Rossellomorea vietnamensis TaxID=218284 RepID=A0A5D4NV32_9BACI|nr:protein kinase [Rossellomorea vietnamensis]TYS16592.1 serine/threonine-protein kinase [Rossellomorea vietnamensis]
MLHFLKNLWNLPLKKGTTLNERYSILYFIGQGSYGQVYLASDKKKDEIVVVKRNRKRKGKNCEGMLIEEAETLSKLDHPSIPKKIDLFQERKNVYLVMEHIHGANFEDLILNEGRIYSERESLSILLEVTSIVQNLHERQCIHRDLRLPNIIQNEKGIHVIDFGLAVFDENSHTQSLQNKTSEKDLFRENSYKSDYYALGHFLLFLLYSNFQPVSKQERTWEEELNISEDTKKVVRKMLRIEEAYDHINDISVDVAAIIEKLQLKKQA